MSFMDDIIQRVEIGNESVMANIINDLINDHAIKKDKMIGNYKRYKASKDPDGVPVFSRKFKDKNKINNKINNSFDADIIDVKVGYMLGNPIIYEIQKELYTKDDVLQEVAYEKDNSIIENFNMRNNIADLDSETLKMASICSYGARLLYINGEGKVNAMNLDPWEVIFITDGSLDLPQYAMRYYEITDGDEKKVYVEWYNDTTIKFYISSKDEKTNTLSFIPYKKDGMFEKPHMFGGIPLIEFANNKEKQGDCERVYGLIDAYDKTLSDINSELEQFRLAYMAFYGLVPSEEVIDRAKRTGALGLSDPDSRVEFLVKQINDNVIEHHLDRIENNIYSFAKSVNFTDEAFGGNISGIAMKFKMFGLESKCITSERKFNTGLRNQYKLLTSTWSIKGTDIDFTSISFIWTRNFPLNLLDESTTAMNLQGIVSKKTVLSTLSIVDDPEKEMAEIERENEGIIDLDENGDIGGENANVPPVE